MSWKPWMEIASAVTFLILATWMIAASGADLSISSQFYIDGRWPIGEQFPWKALYRLDRIPAIALALAGLIMFMVSFWKQEQRHWRRSGAFLVFLLILGPGLLVNTTFKGLWGRPRPREIVQYGGQNKFQQPWEKGISGTGRSFPSGHASAAFFMTAPFYIYRRSRKRLAYAWLAGGLVFGIFMSIARIAQGAHFVSDNLWAWGMVHLCAMFLAVMLKLDHAATPPASEP